MVKAKKSKANHKAAPSAVKLFRKTWFEISTFWRPLLGIISVYAVLQFVLVMGFSFSATLQDDLLLADSQLGKVFSGMFSALNASVFIGNSQSDASALIQLVLFIIASMAIIWALRKFQATKTVKIRDAYYLGTSRLIPTFIVALLLIATLVPMVIAGSLFTVLLQSQGSTAETVLVSAATGLLLLVSIYLFVTFWPAFYIVTLPGNDPFRALKDAFAVTKKRRFVIILRALLLFIAFAAVLFVTLLPLSIVIPNGIPGFVFIYTMVGFVVAHVYFYTLYRELL